MDPRSGRLRPVRSDTSVDFPAPLRPTRPWHSPARMSSETSTSAFVSPNDFETWSASPTGAGSATGPVDELRSISKGFSTSGLLVVAPQAAAVHLCRAVVAGLGDQRGCEAVLEVARNGLDGAVVVGGRTRGVLGAFHRLLRVVDRVVRVL